MLELKESLILYHGSYCEVSRPDLRKCAKMKDFGQGFHLISSKEQAESFLKLYKEKKKKGAFQYDHQHRTANGYPRLLFRVVCEQTEGGICLHS